ncbi:hypothetical protein Tsubulata_049112 [Turnera subulata]|uniref:F-box domain-containing protein n=1 Tax=Turnera subulata TaxID=218843 RepID=A0A9Q0JMF0_9ROSI|nr:hypothetical protein Tsubulata_049112 [Turnera subulata]
MAAQNRSYLPPDIIEEILDLLPIKSIDRFRSVSKSLLTFLVGPKLLCYPYLTIFSPSNYGCKSSDDQSLFTVVILAMNFPISGCKCYGFGYDSASDDYRVFVAAGPYPNLRPGDGGDGSKVEIFSLKRGS